MKILTDQELRDTLKNRAKDTNQKRVAEGLSVSTQYMSDLINSTNRAFPESIATKLGYERVWRLRVEDK